MVIGYLLGKSLHDGTLTHTGFSDEDGVVLLATTQNLNDTLYFLLTAYAGIQFPIEGCLRQVCAEGVEHGCLRGWLLGLCGGRAGFSSVSGFAGCACLLEFFLVLVGQAYATGDIIGLGGVEQRLYIIIIHTVQF